MTPICATFSDFRLVKGRKVCQLVCEVPLEQADAALAALGGLPNPHAERWVGIVPLKAQPQGQDNSRVGAVPLPRRRGRLARCRSHVAVAQGDSAFV